MSEPQFQDWGLIDYRAALVKQLELVDLVSQNKDHPGFLIFCSHPPIVTTGRQTKADDIFAWNGEVVDISRGGRATYHGPSQLVVYPILSIKQERGNGRKAQEVRGFLRAFEEAIAATLGEFGISASGNEAEDTGVWVDERKIASLGIAVKKWITYHGAAINIDYDPDAFIGLNPCGFTSSKMISAEQVLGKKINRIEFSEKLRLNLTQRL